MSLQVVPEKISFECPELGNAIHQAIEEAVTFNRNASFAAEPADDPYAVVIARLRKGIMEAARMRSHKCEFDSNDLCIHCGEDGRS